MPRKLPFDVAVGSLLELVDGMVPGEESVLTVQEFRKSKPKACREHRMVLTLCYAGGLRLSEAIHLKISDSTGAEP